MLGWLMAPLVWLAGVPWAEAATAGALMGTKTVLNEFIAYFDMARAARGEPEPAQPAHHDLLRCAASPISAASAS